jgi:transposase
MLSTAELLLATPSTPSAAVSPEERRHGAGNPNTGRDADQRCAPHCDDHARRPLRTSARDVRRPRSRRRGYPSDLTDSQWQRLQSLLRRNSQLNRVRSTDVRAIMNAVNYRWRCGCTWRMLPHDFPPWETVYGFYRRWRRAGILPVIRAALLHRHAPDPRWPGNVDSR